MSEIDRDHAGTPVSPAWAADLTHALNAALPQATLAVLPGYGHQAIDAVPGLIYRQLAQFLA